MKLDFMYSKNRFIEKNKFKSNISVLGSPIWIVLKRFGRDEFISLIFSIVSTVIISIFTPSILILSIGAPIIEKIGFFPGNFYDAYKNYKHKTNKKSLSYHLNSGFKNSIKTLLEDLFLHDPIYIFLMYSLLSIYSKPIWLITFFSFIVAVVIVSLIEASFVELNYFLFKYKLKKLHLKEKSYYEARFLILKDKALFPLFKKIINKLNLKHKQIINIKDIYFENKLKRYSDRNVVLRFSSYCEQNKNTDNSIQIIYSRSKEFYDSSMKFDQYRYFLISKTKLKYDIDNLSLNNLKSKNYNLYKFFKINTYNKKSHGSHSVTFNRTLFHNDELSLSIDECNNKNFLTFEIKVFKDKKLLIEVMQYVMRYLPVFQTTESKLDMHKSQE
jgi:hypothetical protein